MLPESAGLPKQFLRIFFLQFMQRKTIMQICNAKHFKEALMIENAAEEMKKLRGSTGMNRKEFCEYFMIPYATVTDWELGHRKMPDYVLRMMAYQIKMEGLDQISEEERKKLGRMGRKPKNAEAASPKATVKKDVKAAAGKKSTAKKTTKTASGKKAEVKKTAAGKKAAKKSKGK